jgi:hypothetical protein
MATAKYINTFSNDYGTKLADIKRRQKIAELLAQQGAEPIDVESVGGVPTPISPFQGLAKLLKSGMGGYLAGKAAADAAALKKEQGESRAKSLESFFQNPDTTMTMPGGSYQTDQKGEALPKYVLDDAEAMAAGPATKTVSLPDITSNVAGGQPSYADRVRMAYQFAAGDDEKLAGMAPALLAATKPEIETIGARGNIMRDPLTGEISTIGVPTEKTDLPDSVQVAEWYRSATPEQRRAWEASKNAGRSITQVNVGPTGVDYGKPEDGLVWARSPNGTVKLDERGAPIAIPYQGGKAYLTDAQKTAGAIQEKANQQLATKIVTDEISRARNIIKTSEIPVTGIAGAAARRIPGTKAQELKGQLETIKARIGFDELNRMRKSSPTGGALGQIAVQELGYLQSVYGSLEQSQNEEAVLYNLDRLEKEVYRLVNEDLKKPRIAERPPLSSFGGRKP